VKIRNILKDQPSFANRVRSVHLALADQQNTWLFNDPAFITINQLLAKSLMPPHKLHFTGNIVCPYIIEDPILVVGWLIQSFFSETLTVLKLTHCRNVPLTLFLVCPNLKVVRLENVRVFESGGDEYPVEQCSGRELPALKLLSYCRSEGLVKQMITPSPKFSMAVVDWSELRVLKLCPHDKEEVVCLQPILDAACNTLEELYLSNRRITWSIERLSFAGLVNLKHLPNLHIFAIYAIIKCNAQELVALRDINLVLSTIPKANQVTKLSLNFTIYGEHPFGGCFEEDWVGMCDEVVRISAGKVLELNLEMSLDEFDTSANFRYSPSGRDELYERIKEKLASLSDDPNICIHWHHSGI